MIYFFAIMACVLVCAALEGWRYSRRRGARTRRRERANRRAVHSKAWNMVFGRRTQRRLSYGPVEPVED